MNAFKRYCKSKGFQLNEDFPYLPYNELQDVECDAKSATITYYHLSITTIVKIERNGEVEYIYN